MTTRPDKRSKTTRIRRDAPAVAPLRLPKHALAGVFGGVPRYCGCGGCVWCIQYQQRI